MTGKGTHHELLRVENLGKRFPGVIALDDVSFDLRAGEVHALLGENGAGKSTLIKVLSGVHAPDAGRLYVAGQRVRLAGTVAAQRLGIATIHQEFNLVPRLTVAENVLLGRQPHRFGLLDVRARDAAARQALKRIGLDVDPRTRVADLGVARQQLVEIAKALSVDAKVLILDEPTAALTGSEVDRLFEVMTDLRAAGVGLIFISHHLEEIARIGDRVTVLRDGRTVTTVPADTEPGELVRLMVGRSIEQQYPRHRAGAGKPLLRVEGLTRAGAFEDVSFEVRAGEVVGLAGLMGAGRTEVLRAVFGADGYDRGRVSVDGRAVRSGDVLAAMSAGVGLVPEDRKGQGLLLDASRPAHANSRVQILLTGLGRVTPDWPTGVAAPLANPPHVNAAIHVWLDREPVTVNQAVLAGGYTGMYVVEMRVPSVVNAGPAELFIDADGRESNRVRIWVEP